ncbi:MAG: hypothetical protein SFV23_12580 [Planctomycetaceae bacterium]|nr:hypothetical protein [Planctomycetaceae bacterium]
MLSASLQQRSGMRRVIMTVSSMCLAVTLLGAANRGPIRNLSLDPDADVVPLFNGVAAEQFDVRMSAFDAHHANVVISNLTDSPLTVALPKAAVGVHVLPQFNPNGGFFQGNQGGNLFNGAADGGNQAQSVGGPLQGMGVNNNGPLGNNNIFGQGFPSLPAEMAAADFKEYGGLATIPAGKSIQLQMKSVCLNYGRDEPRSKLTYRLIPAVAHSSDPLLAELLEGYTDRVDRDVMQAAVWHVANGLSWDQIRQLPDRRIPGVSATLFNRSQVESARKLVAAAEEDAKSRPHSTTQTPAVATR